MTWQYRARLAQWEATDGTWRAVVRQENNASGWYAYVERIHPPHDPRYGPTSSYSLEGRIWCEAEINRLTRR